MEKEKVYKSESIRSKVIIPGDSSELPDDFFNVAVFIDNAYLIRLKNYFFKRKFKYSLKDFVLKIAEANNLVVEKIFIYDAPPFQTENPTEWENKKKEDYDKFASYFREEEIILREGRTQRLKIGDKFVYRQKGVDMLLGIDAVSAKNDFPNIKVVVLLTGDSDFVPVVEKLKKLMIPVFLWTYFEKIRGSPFSKSNFLIKSVSRHFKLTKECFETSEILNLPALARESRGISDSDQEPQHAQDFSLRVLDNAEIKEVKNEKK
ncbi:MAG: NYN domain-containing protein [Nanoarchaeota archaeon]